MSIKTILCLAAATLFAPVSWGSLPLYFEPNNGQTDARAEFLARGPGYVLFLDAGEAVVRGREEVVRLKFLGTKGSPEAEGLEPLPGRSSYLRGGDGSRDIRSVTQYGRVLYRGLYPGIDIAYYGKDRQLEYDFIVQPGADPSQIRFSLDGARNVRLDADGNLVTSAGLRFHKPILYQQLDGKRVEVAGSFELKEKEVAFSIGSYRRDSELIIDPVLTWATYLGGSGSEDVVGIGTDAAGNVYVAGTTTSTDFPSTSGAWDSNANGSTDIFVLKLNSTGTSILYSTYIGSATADYLNDMAVGADGRVLLAAATSIPVSPGAYNVISGATRAILLKADGSGAEYVASVPVGSFAALAADGTAYLAGPTWSDLTVTPGAFQQTRASQDVYIFRLNASGTALLWATYLGGSSPESVSGLTVDASGAPVLTGYSHSTDFPVSPGAFQAKGPGPWVARLSASGSTLTVSTFLKTAGTTYGIQTGVSGDIFVIGSTNYDDLPVTAGAYLTKPILYSSNAFLMRLNPAGSSVVLATYLGQFFDHYQRRLAMKVTATEEVVIAGLNGNIATPNVFQPHSVDGNDAYIARLNASGSVLRYAGFYGGGGVENVRSLAIDGQGSVYVAGSTTSSNLPLTAGAIQNRPKTSADGYISDAFIIKVDDTNVACAYEVTPASFAIPASGGIATVQVTTGAGCAWAMWTGTTGYIKSAEGDSRIGSGTATIEFKPNAGTYSLEFELKMAGQTIRGVQPAVVCGPLDFLPIQSFDAGGGLATLTISRSSNCRVAVSSNVPWVTVVPDSSGYATTIQYVVTPNSGAPRTGTLSVGDRKFTIIQRGSGCNYSLTLASRTVPAAGGSFTTPVGTTSACSWTANTRSSWLQITSGSSGTGQGTVSYAVLPNPGSRRDGSIVIGGVPMIVTQEPAACTFSLLAPSQPVSSKGGILPITVVTGAGCAWPVATVSEDWARISAYNWPGAGRGVALVQIGANTGPERTGTLTMAGQTISIRQSAAEGCSFTLTSSSSFVQARPSSPIAVQIEASGPSCQWWATSTESWAQVFPLSGTGNSSVTVNVFPNFRSLYRSALVVIGGASINIQQNYDYASTAEERFVGSMYFASFGRTGSQTEIMGHVNSGRTDAEIVTTFLNSPEFIDGAKFVAGLYVGLLGRDAEYGGWMFQRDAMARGGATPHGLVSNFINSAEFKLKNPNITDPDFVRLLYRQIMGREASQTEVDFQVRNMSAANNRVNLAVAFLTSAEYRVRVGPRLTGFLLHALLLQRDPSISELTERADQIAFGDSLTSIVEDMLAVSEPRT